MDKDVERNVVVIEQGSDHPALYSKELDALECNFTPSSFPFRCTAKVRYRQEDQPCTMREGHRVIFDEPKRAITPRQSVVFYDGDVCLGGGLIKNALERSRREVQLQR